MLCFIGLTMPLTGCEGRDADGIAIAASKDQPRAERERPKEEDEGGEEEGEFCEEHQVPEDECGICHPENSQTLSTGEELKVRFESSKAVAKAGLQTAKPRTADSIASLRVISEVSYNQNKLARITPVVSGIVQEVYVEVGQDVDVGDALVQIHSAEIASAKAEFISSQVNATLKSQECKRERRLAKKKISSTRDLQVAEAACRTAEMSVTMARQKLLNMGFTDSDIKTIKQQQDASALLTIRTPLSGTVVERNAVVGELTQTGDALFQIADLSTMWLSLSVPPNDADKVRVGMSVKARFGAPAPMEVSGEITWVAASLGERSRMLSARAVVDNTDRKLRAGMFGYARVLTGATSESSVVVPTAAVQQFENNPYVFVKLEEDLYALRRVTVHDKSADQQTPVSGVGAEEEIVVGGAFTAMSEFLKSRLGAGCVDD
jgi:cobalt-zinc-cadmium efflux system membrane fusion protein